MPLSSAEADQAFAALMLILLGAVALILFVFWLAERDSYGRAPYRYEPLPPASTGPSAITHDQAFH